MDNKKTNLTLEDYESEFSYTKSKNDINISFNRVAFIFFIFLIIALVFSLKSTYFGFLELKNKKISIHKKDYRSSIVDRNGNILATSIPAWSVFVDPKEVLQPNKSAKILHKLMPEKDLVTLI